MRKIMFNVRFAATAIIVLVSINYLKAQDFYVSFKGQGSGNKVDSVIVENITQGIYTIIKGSEILHLSATSTGINNIAGKPESKVQFFPNPMIDKSEMHFYLYEEGKTTISVFDPAGRLLMQRQDFLEKGNQSYNINGLASGMYFVIIQQDSYLYTGKLLSNSSGNNACCMLRNNFTENPVLTTTDNSPGKVDEDFKNISKQVVKGGKGGYVAYNFGDRIKFTGVGNDIAVTTSVIHSDTTITFDFYPCTDGDGNKYATVKIGNQIFMAENLKTTKFNDGSDIPFVSDSALWGLRTPAYCWFKNDESKYKNLLGGDYNWYTVSTYKLCPQGWHVPSVTEWQTMEDYLIKNKYNYDNSTSGNLIGKSVASPFTSYIYLGSCLIPNMWFTSSDQGVVGNTDYSEKFNSSGFSAIPTGLAGINQFGVVGNTACFWSSTESNLQMAYFRRVNYNWEWFSQSLTDKIGGLSVRCVKD